MKEKSASIQALRALACLTVFFNHCYLTNMGKWGVSLFFVLSGFLLVQSRLNRAEQLSLSPLKCLEFAWSKVKKLYPLYIIALLPILLLDIFNACRMPGNTEFAEIAKRLVLSALLLQSWSPKYCMAFNGVAWYLSVSVFLYFSFPYILRMIASYRSKKTGYTAAVLLLLLETLLALFSDSVGRAFPSLIPPDSDMSFSMWFTYIFPPFRALDFALGCNLGFLFINRNKNLKSAVKYIVDASVLILFAAVLIIYRRIDGSPVGEKLNYTVLFTPLSLAAVYCFALNEGVLPKLLTNRFTLWLGNISGQFYLIHQDVIRILLMLSGFTSLSFNAFRLLAVPVAFCLTALLSVLYLRLSARVKKRSAA